MKSIKIFIILFYCSYLSLTLKSQETVYPYSNHNFFVSFKESLFFPRTNDFIYGFLNSTLMFGINPNSSNSYFSIGPTFTRDFSDFYGFNANYRLISNYGYSRHNFVFNAGYKFLFTEFNEVSGIYSYNHRINFHTFYLGIGYQLFLGKEERFYLAPMANFSLNFLTDNLYSINIITGPSGRVFKISLDGIAAPLLDFEIGIKLNRKKAKL